MQIELNDDLWERFRNAIIKSGENEKTVIERMFKTYVYDVFSKEKENYYSLEPFLSFPRAQKETAHD